MAMGRDAGSGNSGMTGRSHRHASALLAPAVVMVGVLLAGCGATKSVSGTSSTSRATQPITATSKPAAPSTTIAPQPVATPTTLPHSAWSERIIASTGQAQDIAPTSTGVYWLSAPGVVSNNGTPVTLYRDVPATGTVTKGFSITGWIGSPALTVTGGWVWMVVGVGTDVLVEQINPATLAFTRPNPLRYVAIPSAQKRSTRTSLRPSTAHCGWQVLTTSGR